MTALRVILDTPLETFVADQVASGAYPDAEAVVRAALDRLREDDLRDRRYHTLIQDGLDDLAAGRSETVGDIDAWLSERGRHPPQ